MILEMCLEEFVKEHEYHFKILLKLHSKNKILSIICIIDIQFRTLTRKKMLGSLELNSKVFCGTTTFLL